MKKWLLMLGMLCCLLFIKGDVACAGSIPEEFYMTAPGSGETFEAGENVKVKWTESMNSYKYTVSLRDLNTDALLLENYEVHDLSYTISSDMLTPGHRYRVAVLSWNDSGKRSGGEASFNVNEGERPEDFNITSPGEGSVYSVGDTIKIKWTDSYNCDGYIVKVRDKTTDTLILNEEEDGTFYKLDTRYLSAGHNYRVAVLSYNSYGERSGGEVNFSVNVSEPYIPECGYKTILNIGDSLDLTGYIDGNGGTINKVYCHYYEIGNENNCGTLFSQEMYVDSFDISQISSGKTIGQDLMYSPGTYALLIHARNEGMSQGVVVLETSITVNGSRPEDFYITNPGDGASYYAGRNVSLSWTNSANCEWYEVDLRDLTTNKKIINGERTNATSYSISGNLLTAGHKYRVAVSSYNSCGERSGGEVTFIIDSAYPTVSYGCNTEYAIGDKFVFSGTVDGNGGKITKVHCNFYEKNNNNNCGVLYSKDMSVNSFDLSEINSGKVIGEDMMLTPGTYILQLHVSTEGMSNGVKLIEEYITVVGGKPEEFYITSPNSNSVHSAGENVVLKWTKSENSDYYKVFLRDTTTTESVLSDVKTTKTSYTIDKKYFTAGHKYRVAVMSYNDFDERSGGEVEFEIMETLPTAEYDGASSYKLGEIFKLTGTISGNGSKLKRVYCHYYEVGNDSNNGVLYDNVVNASSLNLSKIATNYVIGKDMMKNAGTYMLRVHAATEGMAEGIELISMKIEVTEDIPKVSGMDSSYTIKKGEKFTLEGSVSASVNLTKVTADVTDYKNSTDKVSLTPDAKKQSLKAITIDTTKLEPGTYEIRIWAKTEGFTGKDPIYTASLTVSAPEAPKISGMSGDFTVKNGEKFNLNGKISAETKLKKVQIGILDVDNDYIVKNPDATTYKLSDITIDTSKLELKAGKTYKIAVWATTEFYTDMTSALFVATLNIEGNEDLEETVNQGSTEKTQETEDLKPNEDECKQQEEELSKPENTYVGDFSIDQLLEYYISAESDLLVSWDKAEFAEYYCISLQERNKGKMVMQSKNVGDAQATSISASYLKPGTPYRVYVTAYADGYLECRQYMDFVTATENGEELEYEEMSNKIVVREDGKITYTHPWGKVYNSAKPTIFWKSNFNLDELRQVRKTTIQVFLKNGSKNDHPVKEQHLDGAATSYTLSDCQGGLYGLLVGYYDADNACIAMGETQFQLPVSISGLEVEDVVEGEASTVSGFVYSAAEWVNVQCIVADEKGNSVMTREVRWTNDGTNMLKIAGSTIDNAIQIDRLAAGKYTLSLIVTDSNKMFTRDLVVFNVFKEKIEEYDQVYKAFAFSKIAYLTSSNFGTSVVNEENYRTVESYLSILSQANVDVSASDGEFNTEKYLLDTVGDCLIVDYMEADNGFSATAFLDLENDRITIAYCGTEMHKDNAKDVLDDIQFAATDGLPGQFNTALLFYENVYGKFGKEHTIYLTGHSLGGALATYVCALTNTEAITVNGANGIALNNILKYSFNEEMLMKYPNADIYSKMPSEWNCINYLTEISDTNNVVSFESVNGTIQEVELVLDNFKEGSDVMNILNDNFHSFYTKWLPGTVFSYVSQNKTNYHNIFAFMEYDEKTDCFELSDTKTPKYPLEDIDNPYDFSKYDGVSLSFLALNVPVVRVLVDETDYVDNQLIYGVNKQILSVGHKDFIILGEECEEAYYANVKKTADDYFAGIYQNEIYFIVQNKKMHLTYAEDDSMNAIPVFYLPLDKLDKVQVTLEWESNSIRGYWYDKKRVGAQIHINDVAVDIQLNVIGPKGNIVTLVDRSGNRKKIKLGK